MNEGTVWLWEHRIPRRELSMITGPSPEKSLVAAWLATLLLRGGPWPDGTPVEADPGCRVMWLDVEAGYTRLLDLLRTLKTPDGVYWPVREPQQDFPDWSRDRWHELVADAAPRSRPAWVIVNDLAADGDLVALETLAAVARDVGCPVTFLYDNASRPPGPVDARSFARMAARMATIVFVSPWDDTGDLRLRFTKAAGERPEALRLRIGDDGIPTVVHRPATPPTTTVDRAAEYLEEVLAGGPLPALDLIASARFDPGFSKRSLDRAKRRLGVRSFKEKGRWWWVLG